MGEAPVQARFAIGWRQVAACVLTLALTSLITSSFSLLAVPLGQEFKPSRMVLMLAMTVVSAVSALISPSLGKLLDRVNMPLAMAIGTALLAAGFMAISLAPSFSLVLAVYALLVAPANILLGPLAATVLLSRWFVRQRGKALGLAISGIALGNFFFPQIFQTFLDAWEWRVSLRALAVMTLALGLGAAAMTVNRPSDRGLFPDGADADPDRSEASPAAAQVATMTILRDPTFWLIAALVATVTAGLKGMVTNLGTLSHDAGIDARSGALLLSTYAASGFVGKLVFAAFADRLRPHLTMRASLAGYALGTVAMAFAAGNYAALAGGVALMGFFGGMMMPMESYLIPRIYGRAIVGRVGGMLNFVLLAFLLVSPPLFGLIFDRTGSYEAIFLTFTTLAVLAFLLVGFVRTERREPPLQAGSPSP